MIDINIINYKETKLKTHRIYVNKKKYKILKCKNALPFQELILKMALCSEKDKKKIMTLPLNGYRYSNRFFNPLRVILKLNHWMLSYYYYYYICYMLKCEKR